MDDTRHKPAWLTDDLADEWVSQEDEQGSFSDRDHSDAGGSLPRSTHGSLDERRGRSIASAQSVEFPSAGTVCIREDVPSNPPVFVNKVSFGTKGIFSPLALERMFEPPSPPKRSPQTTPPRPAVDRPATLLPSTPVVPSRLSQVYIPGEESTVEDDEEYLPNKDEGHKGITSGEDGRKSNAPPVGFQFTFAMKSSPLFPTAPRPNALSTPGRPSNITTNPPHTDPRLRLFQLNYDTFTRDHLSAMIDSIQVNTPSGNSDSGFTKFTPPSERSSGVMDVSTDGSLSRLRSAKRLKLSPSTDFAERDGTAIVLRQRSVKDYVGESRSLMEKIKQAQDFSSTSTLGTRGTASAGPQKQARAETSEHQKSAGSPVLIAASQCTSMDAAWTAESPQPAGYSSLARRQGAVALMDQIRQDMKRHKRMLSVETEASEHHSVAAISHDAVGEDGEGTAEGDTEIVEGGSNAQHHLQEDDTEALFSSTEAPKVAEDMHQIKQGVLNVSIDSQDMLDQFPAPLVLQVTASSPPPPLPLSAQPTASGLFPTYPSASVRRKEDLTRFVSSSTASGTTLTAESAGSFVKHQGSKPSQMTRITPNDIAHLPDRVGKMVFDRVQMKWVKVQDTGENGLAGTVNESDDPFKDIESLRVDDSQKSARVGADVDGKSEGDDDGETRQEDLSMISMELDQSRMEEQSESERDEEEAELTSFSCDYPLSGEHRKLSQDFSFADDDKEYTETTEQFTLTGQFTSVALDPVDGEDDHGAETRKLGRPALQDTPPHRLALPPSMRALATPFAPSHVQDTASRSSSAGRSALKQQSTSTAVTNAASPVSALKRPPRSKLTTPANQVGHRRSVSFSDGKRDGQIAGIGRNIPTPDETLGSEDSDEDEAESEVSGATGLGTASGSGSGPSLRSKRIAVMLDALEDTSYMDETPLRMGNGGKPSAETVHTRSAESKRGFGEGAASGKIGDSRRAMSRRSVSLSARSNKSSGRNVNTTFLTECSFRVTHDRLVQVITDVQPYEPYWENLTTIDLSGKNLESVLRLKEFLPKLDCLQLNSNQVSYLSGVPGTIRTLSAACNRLSSVTSYSHLLNLESLDISHNEVESLRQLECLRHLRELRAEGNLIRDLDGLENMDGLVKLSLQDNDIEQIDLTDFRWTRLEMLNLSQNRLVSIEGLSLLPTLIALNLDNNHLGELDPGGAMPKLRILRVSSNRLQALNAGPFPNLRTLYADNNALGPVFEARRLTRLESLSLRNQSGHGGLSLAIRDIRDVKRLYLSGNPLQAGFISEPCYNLHYLELAACRLTTLPAGLAGLMPNVRVLNLNYNFLEDVRPLEGLVRLRKLTLIGSRIKATKQLVRMLKGMVEAEVLDFRMNPCTLGWYLPLLVKDVSGALQPSDNEHRGPSAPARSTSNSKIPPPPTWKDFDAKFRRDLPDEAYVGRLGYRGLVMRACPGVRVLDGVEVTAKEREKAERLLRSVLGDRVGRARAESA